MFRKLITLAAVAAALSLPSVASAMHGPGNGAAVTVSTSPVNLLRDGKYLAPPQTSSPATVQIVRVVKPGGFDFVAAAIGAALGAAALALVGGLVIALHRDNHAATARTLAG
jgi:hypothetical protein